MLKNALIAGVCLLTLAACTDSKGATDALLDAGYSNVTIKGHDFFACGQDDAVATSFTATGPTGRPVRGTVCSGILVKDQTIRLKR
jgi:hypothetical protein